MRRRRIVKFTGTIPIRAFRPNGIIGPRLRRCLRGRGRWCAPWFPSAARAGGWTRCVLDRPSHNRCQGSAPRGHVATARRMPLDLLHHPKLRSPSGRIGMIKT
jgi:hypothetical protein